MPFGLASLLVTESRAWILYMYEKSTKGYMQIAAGTVNDIFFVYRCRYRVQKGPINSAVPGSGAKWFGSKCWDMWTKRRRREKMNESS